MSAASTTETNILEKRLAYTFRQPGLLAEALRHSSFVNEQNDSRLTDNEKLEFLGDAVINLVVGHLLMLKYPGFKEGDLSRVRANLVNESQLSAIARQIELGSHIKLGKGEQLSGGSDKDSILADALEALVAAVYLDGGFQAAYQVVTRLFQACLENRVAARTDLDYKSRLQEVAQNKLQAVPTYRIVSENGPDHAKVFRAEVRIAGIQAIGEGKSKKAAQQNAASKALELLESDMTTN